MSSSSLSGTGFPFIELLSFDLATTSSKSPSFRPNSPKPGTPQSFTKFTIHATPSSTVAFGSPVTVRATVSYRARYLSARSGSFSPNQPFSAATLTVQQCGRSAAQMAPCGACNKPPRVPLKPCTAPSFAFARERPP